jgi:hypothetical protein
MRAGRLGVALGALGLGLVLFARLFPSVEASKATGARQISAEPQQVKARVRFEVLGTQREHATGGPQAETRVTLGAGEGVTRHLAAGGADDPDICHAGFVNDPSSVHPIYLWQLDVRMLIGSPSETTLELRWRRSRVNQGEMQAEAGDTRTVTLGLGEYQIFDYVNALPSSPSSCMNLVLRVAADPLPQPDPQPLLTLDLWLAHDGKTGPRWVHQRVSGRSGQSLPFRLEALKWSPAGAPIAAAGEGPAIGLEIRGTISATLRPEGFLDVSVRAVRSLTWGRARLRGEGQEDFRCAVGESVALLLPDPKGEATAQAATGGPTKFADGVFLRGEKTIVNFARFFAGSQASLHVVVRKR